jgi:hypothetical protein
VNKSGPISLTAVSPQPAPRPPEAPEGSAGSGKALAEVAGLSSDEAMQRLSSTACGLTADQVEERLRSVGPNQVAHEARHMILGELVVRSQTTIPTDNVDVEYLAAPRQWDISNITTFVLFIGPISSHFDCVTYFIILYVFDAWSNPALFQTSWFVESPLTQTLIIHIIRTAKIPFLESRATAALTTTSLVIAAIGIAMPFSWLGGFLGFIPRPPTYWIALCLILPRYAVLTHIPKTWFVRRFGLS